MTLTILDPRTGNKVTITVPDKPRVTQPTPAEVIAYPQAPALREAATRAK